MTKTRMSVAANHRVLFIYAAWMALMQFEWLRFAPVTDAAAAFYKVEPSAIGNLALVFPLLCVVLGIPAGVMLDRLSVRFSLRVIAAGMTLAALVRVPAVQHGYGFVMAGQLVFALLQPLVLGLVGRVTTVWFEAAGRLQATAIASMAMFIGICLAFLLVPVVGGHSLWLDVMLLGVVLLLTWVMVPDDVSQTVTPSSATRQTSSGWRAEVAAMLRSPVFVMLTLYFFFANGYFNAVSTWLEPILKPHGISAQQTGVVALCMLLSGIVSMALADRIARWLSMRSLMLMAALVPMGVTLVFFYSGSLLLLCVAAVALGVALLAPLPLLIDKVVEVAGTSQDGMAASVFWMVGNAGAVLYLAALGAIADSAKWGWGCAILLALLVVQGIIAIWAGRYQVLGTKLMAPDSPGSTGS